jgi:ribosome-binding protein aMBF1 (putative translation factor)
MTPFADIKRRWLADPAVKAEYDVLEDEFALIAQLIEARARAGLTQAEVAARMGTKQAAVARLEGGRVRPSLATLRRFAQATGAKLVVRLDNNAA